MLRLGNSIFKIDMMVKYRAEIEASQALGAPARRSGVLRTADVPAVTTQNFERLTEEVATLKVSFMKSSSVFFVVHVCTSLYISCCGKASKTIRSIYK